jgi:hydrogenase/urease accessory protein HupE
MGRYGELNYSKFTKTGFFLGVSFVVIGVLGELIGTSFYGSLPAWENMLFTGLEILGILLGLLSPFIFGIFLPLTE